MLNSHIKLRIFNYICFYLCWCALIIYNNIGVILFLVFLVAHLILVARVYDTDYLKVELYTIIVVSLIGISIDTVLTYIKIYNFYSIDASTSSYFKYCLPAWYIALWPLLGTTLHHSLYLFSDLNKYINAFIGLVTVPFIYYTAAQVNNDFYLDGNIYIKLLIVGLVWMLLLPLLINISIHYRLKYIK